MTTTETEFGSVLAAVTDLVPKLRENGLEAENRRWILDENVELLEKAGVFRMAVPRRFGGLELPVAEQVQVLMEIARGCSSTGWVAMIWVSSTWLPSQLPDTAQEEIYSGGSTRVSTGFSPDGTLEAVEGGYKLSGTWKWISGSFGANWVTLAAIHVLPDGTPAPHVALVPVSELINHDDWNASAAVATGSATVTAREVFVPSHRVTSLVGILQGTTGDRSNAGVTGRNYPFVPYFVAQGACSYLGIAKGAYELFLDRLPGRGITYTSWTEQSRSPLTQIQVATAANKIAAAEALQDGWLRKLQEWADTGHSPSRLERAAVRGQTAYAVELAKQAVEVLHTAAGASVISREVPFQRFHRDILGLSLHGLFLLNTNLEVHGRAILGLPPETPLL